MRNRQSGIWLGAPDLATAGGFVKFTGQRWSRAAYSLLADLRGHPGPGITGRSARHTMDNHRALDRYLFGASFHAAHGWESNHSP
jgi:hypothetical protein